MPLPKDDYLEAYKVAGERLQSCMDASRSTGFAWIKARPTWPSFADLVFCSGQSMYAVLLVAATHQKQEKEGSRATFEITDTQRKALLRECERYHLEPVVFPIWLGIMEPLTKGWNLISLKTMELVHPGAEADTLPIPMSKWELCNFCMQHILLELQDKRQLIVACHDMPDSYPHIWFVDENEQRSWISVLCEFGAPPSRIPDKVKALQKDIPGGTGYVARMGVIPAERMSDIPMRGDALMLNYKGLEKLP